jgi:hypothetical protein
LSRRETHQFEVGVCSLLAGTAAIAASARRAFACILVAVSSRLQFFTPDGWATG